MANMTQEAETTPPWRDHLWDDELSIIGDAPPPGEHVVTWRDDAWSDRTPPEAWSAVSVWCADDVLWPL
jgi:hypothetical protein